jgi:uncharacterized membrane protein required for colicin V production
MSFFDVTLIVILSGFALFGLWFGLVHTLGSLVGTIFGAYLASRYYEVMGQWLMNLTGWGDNVSKVIMFIIAFILINRLVGVAFWLIDRLLSVFTKLPGVRALNHVSGMVLGLFEGALTLGLIIYFIERFPLGDTLMNSIATSLIAPYLAILGVILIPLLPEALRLLHSSIDYAEGVFLNFYN